MTTTRVAQAVAGTLVPGAGTWRVGACAQTTVALDDNDFVNGYVQVTTTVSTPPADTSALNARPRAS